MIEAYKFGKKIIIPDFDFRVSSAIEGYERVIKEIMVLWGDKEEFNKYVDSILLIEPELLLDGQGRKGFSLEALSDISMLRDLNRFVYGIPKSEQNTDVWNTHMVYKG
nr:hypothetical protein [Candidatus Gracilibacteria bacterium]